VIPRQRTKGCLNLLWIQVLGPKDFVCEKYTSRRHYFLMTDSYWLLVVDVTSNECSDTFGRRFRTRFKSQHSLKRVPQKAAKTDLASQRVFEKSSILYKKRKKKELWVHRISIFFLVQKFDKISRWYKNVPVNLQSDAILEAVITFLIVFLYKKCSSFNFEDLKLCTYE